MAAIDSIDSLLAEYASTPEARSQLLTLAIERLAFNRIEDYCPYPKQQLFHELGKTMRERLLRAGNQNGKSFCVGAEASYHLTGRYPKPGDPGFPEGWKGRVFDHPTVVWASGETAEATRDNPQRVLLGLPGETGTGSIPDDCLGGEYGMASGTADLYDYIKVKHHTNGVFDGWSMLRLKYYAQGRRKWQGPPVDFVWFDEEPPEEIYDEGLARTIASGGMAAMSFTPSCRVQHFYRMPLKIKVRSQPVKSKLIFRIGSSTQFIFGKIRINKQYFSFFKILRDADKILLNSFGLCHYFLSLNL